MISSGLLGRVLNRRFKTHGEGDLFHGGVKNAVCHRFLARVELHERIPLEPGQVAPQLVESEFGFHVMKLERKDVGTDQTYDVRHILITTAVSDPSNPAARPVPVNEYVRGEIESEKERLLIDKLVVANKISVPEDFVVPSAAAPQAPKAKPAAKKRTARKRT